MMQQPKPFIALCVLVFIAHLIIPTASSAITAELAKKCRSMAIQAHPTQLPGRKNTGVEAAQREYFSKCIATEGKMDTAEPNQNRAPNPNERPPVIGAPSTVPSEKK